MNRVIFVTKALADESRLRAVAALEGGELCVCQIIELLALAPSTVSKHMSILKRAGLVESRKEGRWIYYRLAGKDASRDVKKALRWVMESLRDSDVITTDRVRLKAICRVGKEALCKTKAGN